MSPAEELHTLLSPSVDDLRAWEQREFDRFSEGRPIVLMGAGGLGRRTLQGLRVNGCEPVALADNTKAGTVVDGRNVWTPAEAARAHGRDSVFVVTIWGANSPHRFAHSLEQLHALGCNRVCAFPPLFWKFPTTFLPFYLQDLPSRLLEARDEVRCGLEVWEDEASRREYVAQVRFRLRADFDGLSHPVGHPQYFPPDLFAWSSDERVVDGGAYDGDSIRMIWSLFGARFEHILAVEPDPANFRKLQATVDTLPPELRLKIDCRPVGLASAPATLHLQATGTAASRLDDTGSSAGIRVHVDALDSLVGRTVPTFIKLDIEGAEIDALLGAERTIRQAAPVLAVCVYHRQDHLWKIPLLLHRWRDDYAFFLRPHNEEGWDLVCYAVPRSRLGETLG